MTATLAAPTIAANSPAELGSDLLLARLLVPTKHPPGPTRIRTDLEKFLGQSVPNEQFQEWVGQLKRAGLVTERPLALTQAGRERGLTFLGARNLPPQCNWGTLQSWYLVPRALGLDPESAGIDKRLNGGEGLAALLLRRKFHLPVGTGLSLTKVLEALACQQLGFPDEMTLEAVQQAVLNRMLGSSEPLTAKQLKKQLPRLLLGAKKSGITGLRDVVLREWADNLSRPNQPDAATSGEDDGMPPSEFDLPAFARTVKVAARDCPSGRFGDNKVFINHLWRRLADEPSFHGLSFEEFKQRLVEAHRANHLTLSRADLVSVMNPDDVQASETRYLNGLFHFVLTEREQP